MKCPCRPDGSGIFIYVALGHQDHSAGTLESGLRSVIPFDKIEFEYKLANGMTCLLTEENMKEILVQDKTLYNTLVMWKMERLRPDSPLIRELSIMWNLSTLKYEHNNTQERILT